MDVSKRVTIILDDDIKKLREKQAKLIKKYAKSIFFIVINDTLRNDVK